LIRGEQRTQRLRRTQRLGAVDVSAALKSRPLRRKRYLTLYARANQLNYARLALIVPKKFAAHAVTRNRIRRLAREAFRLRQAELEGLDCVVRLTQPPVEGAISLAAMLALLARAA
jgi:ribonuclease P protein component